MSKRVINITGATAAAPKPGLFREIETAIEQIRDRAYSLWEKYGSGNGTSVDHWLTAERELFEIPDFAFSDTEQAYELEVALQGYTAEQLGVTVDDGWITLQGKSEQRVEKGGEVESISRKEMFRRMELPSGIDLDKIAAVFENGKLRITMPKVSAAPAKARAAAA